MLTYRKANKEDVDLYYAWANDKEVRDQSFTSTQIAFEDHKAWFEKKLLDESCTLLVFENENNIPVGQVRFQEEGNGCHVIGISIAAEHRGKGYSVPILKMSSGYFFDQKIGKKILAFVKEENIKSRNSFERANFVFECNTEVSGNRSYKYVKYGNES